MYNEVTRSVCPSLAKDGLFYLHSLRPFYGIEKDSSDMLILIQRESLMDQIKKKRERNEAALDFSVHSPPGKS
jgi:hypothetical protein